MESESAQITEAVARTVDLEVEWVPRRVKEVIADKAVEAAWAVINSEMLREK